MDKFTKFLTERKNYFYIADVDDRDYLVNLIKATLPALPKPKAKKNPTTNQ